jgi:hypothetical protein
MGAAVLLKLEFPVVVSRPFSVSEDPPVVWLLGGVDGHGPMENCQRASSSQSWPRSAPVEDGPSVGGKVKGPRAPLLSLILLVTASVGGHC